MKIEVSRMVGDENELVFIIKCSNPHQVPFDMHTLDALELCRKQIMDLGNREHLLTQTADNELTDLLCQAFHKSKNNMTAAIKNQLLPKFNPICEEVYSWIFDHQDEQLRHWMLRFDAARTRYYFDNDPEMQEPKPQAPEWDE